MKVRHSRHKVYLPFQSLGLPQPQTVQHEQRTGIFSPGWRLAACDDAVGSVSLWREPSSWLQAAVFSLCPHMALREKDLPSPTYITANLLGQDPTQGPHLTLVASGKPHLSPYLAPAHELGGRGPV